MSDGFLGFIISVCAIAVAGLFWVGGKADIASDCRAMGMTSFGGAVFKCEEVKGEAP